MEEEAWEEPVWPEHHKLEGEGNELGVGKANLEGFKSECARPTFGLKCYDTATRNGEFEEQESCRMAVRVALLK